MKFKDPTTISCPQCDKQSEQRVQRLLAQQAHCPFCDFGFAEIGAQMQRMLDDARAFAILFTIESEIEHQNPQLKFPEELPLPDNQLHQLCLNHILARTERLLIDIPAIALHDFALHAVEAAFRMAFPDTEYPSLDTQLAYYIRGVPFGRLSQKKCR